MSSLCGQRYHFLFRYWVAGSGLGEYIDPGSRSMGKYGIFRTPNSDELRATATFFLSA
jgi:hypothetical protein